MGKPKFNFTPAKFEETPIQSNLSPETIEEPKAMPTEPQKEDKESTEISVTPSSILNQEDKNKDGFSIKIIPRKKIRTNKKNCYGIRDIEKLKDSILHFGLQQNLTVLFSVEEDRYIIEAGHRRCQALDELINDFSGQDFSEDNLDEKKLLYLKNVKGYELGYPCKVNGILKDELDYDSTEDETTLLSEARLIITNEDVRSSNPSEKAAAVARLEEIYQKLNFGKKKNEKINVMEKVAEDLNIGKSQVATYKAFNNLLPELKEEFEKKKITLKEGSEIGKLNEDEQHMILSLLQSGEKISIDQIKQLKKDNASLQASIKDKEKQISALQNEITELEKKEKDPVPDGENLEMIESLKKEQKESEVRAKEELHRKEDEIKLLMKQVEELKNRSVPVLEESEILLYRAEISAKAAYENFIKAEEEFLSQFKHYEKLLLASPKDEDRSLYEQMQEMIRIANINY